MSVVTRRRRLTFVGGGAAAVMLLVAVGAAGAVAASRVLSSSDGSQAVIDDAATQLGVKPKELSDALKQALKNRIDSAVDSGKLTEEQAKQLKQRIDSDEFPLVLGPGLGIRRFGPGLGHRFGSPLGDGHPGGFAVLETAAAPGQDARRDRKGQRQIRRRPREGACRR